MAAPRKKAVRKEKPKSPYPQLPPLPRVPSLPAGAMPWRVVDPPLLYPRLEVVVLSLVFWENSERGLTLKALRKRLRQLGYHREAVKMTKEQQKMKRISWLQRCLQNLKHKGHVVCLHVFFAEARYPMWGRMTCWYHVKRAPKSAQEALEAHPGAERVWCPWLPGEEPENGAAGPKEE